MSLGEWLTTFRRVAILLTSEANKSNNSLTLEDEGTTVLRNVENHSATRQHIVAEPSPRLNSVQFIKMSGINI